jgi:hypothetical protein
MHLKFNPYVGYTHCEAHLTCLKTSFNGHYSLKNTYIFFCEHFHNQKNT